MMIKYNFCKYVQIKILRAPKKLLYYLKIYTGLFSKIKFKEIIRFLKFGLFSVMNLLSTSIKRNNLKIVKNAILILHTVNNNNKYFRIVYIENLYYSGRKFIEK